MICSWVGNRDGGPTWSPERLPPHTEPPPRERTEGGPQRIINELSFFHGFHRRRPHCVPDCSRCLFVSRELGTLRLGLMRTAGRLQSADVALNFPFTRDPGANRKQHFSEMATRSCESWIPPTRTPSGKRIFRAETGHMDDCKLPTAIEGPRSAPSTPNWCPRPR
jgi:hypothetical protein